MIDTRHFDADFTARLLDALGDIDEQTDGVLVHSENFQALNLMQRRYREKIKCVYIDPPYNTGNDDFLYKDNYQHSSWLSMVHDRLERARRLMSAEGGLFASIDYNEEVNFKFILEDVFGSEQYRNTIIPSRVKKSIMEKDRVKSLNWGTGSLLFFASTAKTTILPPIKGLDRKSSEKWHAFDAPGIRPTMEYSLFGRKPPVGRHWMYSQENAQRMITNGELRLNQKSGNIQYRIPNSNQVILDTNWTDIIESSSKWSFLTEKNIDLLVRAFKMMVLQDELLLDFFAGSGTTGHAVINLNREDGGKRKFILVEMADYFDTVLLPRLKKVTFTPEWKDGKPKRLATTEETERSPRMFKVIRLESYEDTLNNLELQRTPEQEDALFSAEAQGPGNLREQYMLNYMLDVESRGSQSLLNIDAFKDPLSYTLKVKRPGSDESQDTTVDLMETFNWLIGLTVKEMSAPQRFDASFERDSEGRLKLKDWLRPVQNGRWWIRTIHGTLPNDNQEALIIWRNLPGNPEENNLVLNEWFKKSDYSTKEKLPNYIYVNGTNNLENIRLPDATWKVRLIEEDFKKLMFEMEERL